MANSGPFNTFSNDGSFLEQFKKMQENQKTTPTVSKPTVTMKLGAVKKSAPPISLRTKVKSTSVKKAFEEETSDNEGEQMKESRKVSQYTSEPTLQEGWVSRPSNTTKSGAHEKDQIQAQTSGMATSAVSLLSSAATLSSSTSHQASPSQSQLAGQKRKRKSRWSDAPSSDDTAIAQAMASFSEPQQLSKEQEMQLKEQLEMNRLVAELRTTVQKKPSKTITGEKRNKYEYDSDEETEGGTWEHKARMKEMTETSYTAQELTERSQGKHHISDFLPPEELEKFIEKAKAIKEGRTPDLTDYKEHKLTEENLGYKLLQKAGWKEGTGLGTKEDGITAPVNKGKQTFEQAGMGAEHPGEIKKEDDAFDVYRKRMMLAYRFRPNPLNNPRRPYY